MPGSVYSPGSRAVRPLVVSRGYGVYRGAKGEVEIPLLPYAAAERVTCLPNTEYNSPNPV